MFAPGVPQVLRDFRSTDKLLGSFVVSVYVLGYATGPLVVAPCSEAYGRLPVYHIGNVLFIVFTVACAVSSNLNMLIGFRFLQGVAGSTPITIGGGTIAVLLFRNKEGEPWLYGRWVL
jgi:MFS family permease